MASLDLDRIRTIVVTGGAGFVGSHIVDDLLAHCPNARIRVLDAFTYAADMSHLDAAFRSGRVTLQEGDVGNLDLVTELLKDADDTVARTAWRTAARHVPAAEASALADVLATQFARGEDDTRRSLSEAFATIGEPARPQVDWALATGGPYTRAHAAVTARLMDDPEVTYAEAVVAVAESA